MPRTWTPKLAVGVPAIDQQHQELFKRSDALIEALSRGEGKTEVVQLANFLEKYVTRHFGDEEKLMASRGYPKLTGHQMLHSEFVKRFTAIHEKIKSGTYGTSVVLELKDLIGKWLVNHIGNEDTQIAAFLDKDQESAGTD